MRHFLVQIFLGGVGLFVGLLLISMVAEGIEFCVVTIVNGEVTTDMETYFGIRNRLPILALKFVYNSFAGFVGGYVASFISGRQGLIVGGLLAAIQVGGLLYGMLGSSFAETTPTWAWIGLMVTMAPAIFFGAWLRQTRNRKRSAVSEQAG